MGDRLRSDERSRYVTSHPGQLSLAIPPWVGATSTSDSWGVNSHTAQCTSPVSVVLHCKLVSGWGLRKRRSAPPYGPCGSGRALLFYNININIIIVLFTSAVCSEIVERWSWKLLLLTTIQQIDCGVEALSTVIFQCHSDATAAPNFSESNLLHCFEILIFCVVTVVISGLRLHKMSHSCPYIWKFHTPLLDYFDVCSVQVLSGISSDTQCNARTASVLPFPEKTVTYFSCNYLAPQRSAVICKPACSTRE